MTDTSREVDGYTHLALSVMFTLYYKGWGKSYPHEIAEIMQKILDLDRKAYKAEIDPQESDHKCHTCKHYTSGEHDGSCGSYICKDYSNWESEEQA